MEIIVEDRGRGFDWTDLPTPHKGGFGLFSVRERLSLVGGHLDVTSASPHGTRARITIPSTIHSTMAVNTDLQNAGRQPIRVLLIDDHPVMRNGLRQAIEDQSDMVVIAEASDGQSGVQLARAIIPDLVVMDINLPIMNGIEATRQIKTHHAGIAVIGVSMHDNAEMVEAMHQAGASNYVSKGSAAETICAVIRSTMNSMPT